jgi:heterotetrameric sarcosine oxidase gamma subunit
LLAAGVPLDLDLSAFPVGMVPRTLLLKAEIPLWRREAERFRLEARPLVRALCGGGADAVGAGSGGG